MGLTNAIPTREEWLTTAVHRLERRVFSEHGYRMPPHWRVSCGWPITGATRAKNPVIGQCWNLHCSADEHNEMTISMAIDDPVRVLDVLTHEMVHAIVGVEHGHKGPFKHLATAIGLEGKMTATVAGAELRETLESIARGLGPYPHGAITPETKRKQSTRLLKAVCEDCGYTVRVTRSWLEAAGAPLCPCNQAEMQTCV